MTKSTSLSAGPRSLTVLYVALFSTFCLPAAGQTNGHRLFIDPAMQGHLQPYIAAEIVKQHVPATLVLDISQADCQLRASSQANESLWHSGWNFYDKDKLEGTLEVVNLANQTVVWAGEAGDRSLLFNPYRRSGNRKIAARIVKQIKRAGSVGGCFTSSDPFK